MSKPSLSEQYPLPEPQSPFISKISSKASLSYPSDDADAAFILSPVLKLPPAFGAAYVGETFSCTLCANNELLDLDTARSISGVRISADMQTPSVPVGAPLDLAGPSDESPAPGKSLQKIVRFELKEEGPHILAVTVTYTETQLAGEGNAASGRIRTFRKLYQFVAQQLLSVRTKGGDLPPRNGLARYSLEAQLENLGESAISLEAVAMSSKPGLTATSLNWDLAVPGQEVKHSPMLYPQEVIQVAFLVEQQAGDEEALEEIKRAQVRDGRVVLGQLAIQWRSAMGDRGSLSTGWLSTRKR